MSPTASRAGRAGDSRDRAGGRSDAGLAGSGDPRRGAAHAREPAARTWPRSLARGVRWVHTFGTGVERFPFDALGGRLLTCSRGASAMPIAEWVLAVMLAVEKRLPETWIARAARSAGASRRSAGCTAGRSAWSDSAASAGGRARARSPSACACARSGAATRRARCPASRSSRDLAELVAERGSLVIAAPATPETRHLIDAAVLARVKPGAAPGQHRARRAGRSGRAARGARRRPRRAAPRSTSCEPEPLPAGHWLYTHPRVRL